MWRAWKIVVAKAHPNILELDCFIAAAAIWLASNTFAGSRYLLICFINILYRKKCVILPLNMYENKNKNKKT